MENENILSPIDMLLDEDNTDNIVLYNESNQPVEFEQIALVPIDDKVYVILKPVNGITELAEDEALVFAIDEVEDQDCLMLVDQEEVIDRVFAIYYEMLEEAGITE